MSDKNFDRFDEIQKEMRTFLEHLHKRPLGTAGFSANVWTPNVNLCETETDYHVLAELPGVLADNLRLMVQDDVLTLQGERFPHIHAEAERCLHLEISTGYFKRQLRLPGPVNRDDVHARFAEGMLSVRLAKRANSSEEREISIQSAQ